MDNLRYIYSRKSFSIATYKDTNSQGGSYRYAVQLNRCRWQNTIVHMVSFINCWKPRRAICINLRSEVLKKMQRGLVVCTVGGVIVWHAKSPGFDPQHWVWWCIFVLTPVKVEKRKFEGHFRIHKVLEASLGYIKLPKKKPLSQQNCVVIPRIIPT